MVIMSEKQEKIILGSSPQHPIPSNTFITAYRAEPNTQLVVVNADDVDVITTVGSHRTIIGIVKKS
jgi:hypothetical protein